jgi:hypothetical protein
MNRYLDWNFSINMNWNLSINIYWLIDINNFLSYGWYLNSFNNLFLNFERDFLLDLNIFRNLNNLLDDSLWTWYRFWNLDYNLNRLFYNYLLNNLFWNDRFKPLNLTISIFEQSSKHINLNFELILFAL